MRILCTLPACLCDRIMGGWGVVHRMTLPFLFIGIKTITASQMTPYSPVNCASFDQSPTEAYGALVKRNALKGETTFALLLLLH